MHLFIEKGMRGGISSISKRYTKVDDNNIIMYWDANNIYGWAMIQPLPVCDVTFSTQKEINGFDLDSTDEKSSVGYILECVLKHPEELHDLHISYIYTYNLCPEKIEVNSDMLSKYCSDIANKYE